MTDIISIVTPSFNQGKFLSDAIESVLKQKGSFYIDYVIIDGLSNDNSVEVIKRYEQLLKENCELKKEGELEYHVKKNDDFALNSCQGISFRWMSEKDKGHADGVNKGMAMTAGNIFSFLNADDVYEQDAFENVSLYFKEYADYGIIYGNGFYINEIGKITGLYPPNDFGNFDLHDNCFLSQPSVFLRMEVVSKAGLFNINIGNSLDYEYWLRLYHLGFKFKYVRNVFSSTRMYANTKTRKNIKPIYLEALAFSHHYNGKLSADWAYKFTQAISLVGKSTRFSLELFKYLQERFVRIYSKIYIKFFVGQVLQVEKKIFRIDDKS